MLRLCRRFALVLVLACALGFSALAQTSPSSITPSPTLSPQPSAVAKALQARLALVPGMEGVRVREYGGVVRLEGAVLRADNRDIAELIAKQEDGVVAVQNRIQLSASLAQRAREAAQDGLERGQRFLLFTRDGNTGNQIRQGFPHSGRCFNRQMPPIFPGKRFRDVSNHLPLRCTRDKVGDLFLKRLIPGGDLRF